METAPASFPHTVPVPGLVSQADPPFVEPGPRVAVRASVPQKDPRRSAFWYRRVFRLETSVSTVAVLKVHKAMFGTRVWMNGHCLGEHAPCFTPGMFDAREALKPGENELLIRVGADRDTVGPGIPSGYDQEKERYLPGIFDSVELILADSPYLLNVQSVPDIDSGTVRVHVEVEGGDNSTSLYFEVCEAKSGQSVGTARTQLSASCGGEPQTVEVSIAVAGCHLWSPEDPFLYTLTVDSGGDRLETRFGMREFRLDAKTGRAVLNGKPYFLRGTNVTLYRFFEDSQCGGLPWDREWVRKLHRSFKQFHWNSIRYCIGFPPEFWYEIADEEGFLIQDEFPIWNPRDTWPDELHLDELVREFTEWIRERRNHACVVLWDSCNETISEETGLALENVRHLDLSNRPWDNGWAAPQRPDDSWECHPYHFENPEFKLRDLAGASGDPTAIQRVKINYQGHPYIINEYGWLWLNRDGSPTTLTAQLYKNLLGADSTVEQRRRLYALYLAAETEFWRCHRQASAVMHFTSLGYSRANGQTSDHFLDVANLVYEPEFLKYLPDAFAPVGLMIDYWNDRAKSESSASIPIVVINDLETAWEGQLRLTIEVEGQTPESRDQACQVEPFGKCTLHFKIRFPTPPGACLLVAQLMAPNQRTVRSLREIEIVP